MLKLSELKNERGLEMLADLMESACKILADKKVLACIMHRKNLMAIKYIAENHKKEALDILAYLNEISVEEYEASALEMAHDLNQLLNDEDMRSFFTLSPKSQTHSGDVSEDTQETGAK